MPEPAVWLAANLDVVPVGGQVLDVASGSGRNALFLASHGWRVHAVDRDAAALALLHQRANGLAAPDPDERKPARLVGEVTTEQVDLESGNVTLGAQCFQAVIVFNYLHRPLMPIIVGAVAPGGVLIYETFTRDQSSRGRPRNPQFLLDHGELPLLVEPLRVLRSREGEFDGKFVASIVAMR
jgi:SAM-dependent methyltransferase